MNAAQVYFQKVCKLIEEVNQTQSETIDKASQWITDSIREGGVLHVFGSGHSHLVGEDLFYRAGGLAPVNAILDYNYTQMGGGDPTRSTKLERLEGYTKIILENYDLREGEILVIASQSGINPAVIEAAKEAKKKGLKVVALTSIKQSSQSKSRHTSGKRLFELADLIIDNCVPVGDAVIEIGEGLPMAAPVSTVIHCAIMQSIVAEVATRLHEQGVEPPIWISANVPGGDERTAELMKRYGGARLRTH
ncbi:MAG: sugar isomerase domain-containing protein [Anaerolineales bacterium]|nr:sugar isomerase domain-containing protein [Anaerolineales bacterium]